MKYLKFLLRQLLRNEFSVLEMELNKYKELAEIYKRTADYADVDELTGCLNRRGMHTRLDTINDDRRQSVRVYPNVMGILMLDLDKFKQVNDTLGHDVGDQVILAAAQAIQASCRQGDIAVRLGGDEFVVILLGTDLTLPNTRKYVESRAKDIRSSIEEKLRPFAVTASIGFTTARTTGDRRSFESCVKRADAAMYQAKGNGGNCVVFAPTKKIKTVIEKHRCPISYLKDWKSETILYKNKDSEVIFKKQTSVGCG